MDQAINEEDEANVALNDDKDIKFVKELMGNFDFEAEDSNWGIEVYCEAVIRLSAIVEAHNGTNNKILCTYLRPLSDSLP